MQVVRQEMRFTFNKIKNEKKMQITELKIRIHCYELMIKK